MLAHAQHDNMWSVGACPAFRLTTQVELRLVERRHQAAYVGAKYPLQVQDFVEHCREVVVIVEPFRRLVQRAVGECLSKDPHCHLQLFRVAERVPQLKLDAIRHVLGAHMYMSRRHDGRTACPLRVHCAKHTALTISILRRRERTCSRVCAARLRLNLECTDSSRPSTFESIASRPVRGGRRTVTSPQGGVVERDVATSKKAGDWHSEGGWLVHAFLLMRILRQPAQIRACNEANGDE